MLCYTVKLSYVPALNIVFFSRKFAFKFSLLIHYAGNDIHAIYVIFTQRKS